MDFDRYTISLLIHRSDAPDLGEAGTAELQDAHMSHLADLHEAGVLLAAGPLFDERYRGLSILNIPPERAQELEEEDPAVRAGLYSIKAVPQDASRRPRHVLPRSTPRSVAEVSDE
jgi:uncharacterized protein